MKCSSFFTSVCVICRVEVECFSLFEFSSSCHTVETVFLPHGNSQGTICMLNFRRLSLFDQCSTQCLLPKHVRLLLLEYVQHVSPPPHKKAVRFLRFKALTVQLRGEFTTKMRQSMYVGRNTLLCLDYLNPSQLYQCWEIILFFGIF